MLLKFFELFKVGEIQPHLPPVKTVLSDFEKDAEFYFTVRVRYRDESCSEFSNVEKIAI